MARNEKMATVLDIRGLDLVTPVDVMTTGRTPYAKNFRLYAQQSDDRRVAVSTRKGPGFYINPLNETQALANEAVTGPATAPVGVVEGVHAQPIDVVSAGRISRIDLKVSDQNSASGPLMVQVYSDDNGPKVLLSESSILSGDIGETASWLPARFVNAPYVEASTRYWIVVRMQDDGTNMYSLSTTTEGTPAWKTSSMLSQLQEQEYSLNFKVHTTVDATDKGAYRFLRDNGTNVTLVVYGTTLYRVDEVNNTLVSVKTGLSASATEYSFTNADNKVFWVNGYDELSWWDGTTTGTVTDTELPILSQIIMHKDRMFGVVANDPNKLVWSEAPGNPTTETADKQWYNAWLSTSFWYVPRPHNGSPITALVSFQDALTIFTQDKKYIFSGYDRGSFFLRESTGSKGAMSARGVTSDENMIYFVSTDGFYQFNGSSDVKISELINPLFDACGQKSRITPVTWNNQVRFYMASQGSPYNDICAVMNKDLEGEWALDTDTYINRALPYEDADDNNELVELSSLVPTMYLAEQNYHSLGAPIDFEYRFKYDSMGTPAQKKRIKRFYPILQGVDNSFTLVLSMDKDFEDSPRTREFFMATNGAKWGNFNWGDGTLYGGDTSFQLKRMSTSGYAYYWQLRVARKGVNNRVAFIGAQFTYKTKRL